MIQRFHDQSFQRMSPERRARKLSVMKALVHESLKTKKTMESQKSTNNNMESPFNFKHSTPLKNQQITDLDVLEAPSNFHSSSGAVEETIKKTEPLLVIVRSCDLTGEDTIGESTFYKNSEYSEEKFENDSKINTCETVGVESKRNINERQKKASEDLNETAEYEFYKKLEASKQFLSTSSLLEEIEADLPSSYSLARPLNHTLHTLASYRTVKRLARVDANLTCPVNLERREGLVETISLKTKDHLETQAMVQKALAKQAEKAVALSKAQKYSDTEHVESEKSLLLANLRFNAAVQELERLKMSHRIQEKENFGQIIISDVCFTPLEVAYDELGKFICVATEKENVQCSKIVSQLVDGNLHFDGPFVFSDLQKHFIIYIELFRLYFKEGKKNALANVIIKKFKKIATVNLNKSLMGPETPNSGFSCVACAELRIKQITNLRNKKCTINFSESPKFPIAQTPMILQLKTQLNIRTTHQGFLNVFHQTWHRRWYLQTGCFLRSWLYPEHKESNKTPLDSINLESCVVEVKIASLEVCIRPNSFLIVLKNSKESILFSADSQKDMFKWISHLNSILEHVHLWNPTL